jgi:hypothetical protein
MSGRRSIMKMRSGYAEQDGCLEALILPKDYGTASNQYSSYLFTLRNLLPSVTISLHTQDS